MNNNVAKDDKIRLRLAKEKDIELVFDFIKELAEYENLSEECVVTKEILFDSLFIRHQAEAVIGEYEGNPVGFALFYESFSTFLGNANIYLEDIFIRPEFRNKGIGKRFFSYLANLCLERGYQRLEWACLDWNEPSLTFYEKMGAKQLREWILHRVDGQNLNELSKLSK